MKKSSFMAMIMGTVGGILTSIGMCMCLLPEWGAFAPGVAMGCSGIAVLLAMVAVWRRMEGKAPINFSGRNVGISLFGIIGAILFGVGLCLVMVWSKLVFGILIGMIGIFALLSLIPLAKGLR